VKISLLGAVANRVISYLNRKNTLQLSNDRKLRLLVVHASRSYRSKILQNTA